MVLNEEADKDSDDELLMSDQKETVVGHKLTLVTMKKVITLVLVMLVATPAFFVTTWLDTPIYFRHGLDMIVELGGSSTDAGRIAFDNLINIESNMPRTPLIKLLVHTSEDDEALQWQSEGYD